MSVALALVALLIEAAVGYPDRLLRAIGHPVIWIGRLIAALDHALNRGEFTRLDSPDGAAPPPQPSPAGGGGSGVPPPQPSPAGGGGSGAQRRGRGSFVAAQRVWGVLALLILLAVVGGIAFAIERTLLLLPPGVGLLLAALVASSLLAQRSLHDHVAHVAAALETDGVEAGREAVSHIVGRDVSALDEAGVARAAIESLAENFSDGVVAPAFWLALAGLPGGALYKAVNTADSMIGHRTPRHEHFGWAAARLDDLLNLPAARLSALLFVAAAAVTKRASASNAWRAVRRDASRHRSPNAGYPESAMAGALGLKLAGPRVYAGVQVEDAYMGDGRREATAADIRRALSLYRRADALLIALLAALAAALIAQA